MQFIRAEIAVGERQLSRLLIKYLSDNKKVLWLVSGGSNVPITTEVMKSLPQNLSAQLTIMLSDERFGAAGHADSNARQLHEAGLNPKAATFLPVLQDETFDATVQLYNDEVVQQFEHSEVIIAQLGIGPDGHTAGILPNSPATSEGNELVTGYQGPDFQRITLKFKALRRVASAFVFAYGANKQATLERLRDKNPDLVTQPAQILKAIPEAYIYNDSVEGKS